MSQRAPEIVTLINASEATVTSDASAVSTPFVTYQITGVTTATVKLDVTLDGTNWYEAVSATANGGGVINGYWKQVRARISAWTSGAISVFVSV